ncbi:muconate cycloisomerase [Rhodotorula toruloides]|uniref:Muconate cycloisomerase n=1 Tax=Rhodotorula toruloides TaxID=5286 RepID=A0A511KQJ4_RHOTO|nr:muconate cycloisomerase [Rhodotorula toruloides]
MAATCPVTPTSSLLADSFTPRLHYLLTGTFNTLFLYLLAFSPYASGGPTLTVHRRMRGEGPHQFIALNEERDRAYVTTWAQPPTLSSWEVLERGRGGVKKIDTVPISATGSYLTVSPSSLPFPPRVYQAGGPVLQTFSLSPSSRGFDTQLQEVIYLDGGEEELWSEKTDRTRVALRYGSHAVDIDPVRQRAYVPHVGRDSIFVYSFNQNGTLHHLAEVPTYGNHGNEGVRHSIPSRDGGRLYVVTEHTSYLDIYTTHSISPFLTHTTRHSVIPPSLDPSRHFYRGDTLRLSHDGRRLYVTTRGKTAQQKGWVSVWEIDEWGDVRGHEEKEPVEEKDGARYDALSRFEARNSGGKAHAIEVFPFHPSSAGQGHDYLVFTDDEAGHVSILEWRDEWCELREVAVVRLGEDAPEEGEGKGEVVEEERGTGASHAVWLS